LFIGIVVLGSPTVHTHSFKNRSINLDPVGHQEAGEEKILSS